jgi:hypothetical protein
MPFEKQVQKLLGEGVNLLPPSDVIGEGEAEKCVNWRPDMVAKLVNRGGMIQLASGLGDWFHTIAHVESPPSAGWFLGVDEKLYNYAGAGGTPRVLDVLTGDPVVFDGDFLGWASMQGYLWVMNRLRQGRVVAANFYPWLPDPPAAAPGVTKVAGDLSGAVKYYIVFETDKGFTSNPSPVSAEISDAAAPFGVTIALPTSTNPEVSKLRIYRVGGKLPAPYLVFRMDHGGMSEITDDGGTLAIANETGDPNDYFLSDAMAIEYGELMEDDHDPPPSAFGLAGPYFERLLAFNSAAHPNRIWYSPTSQPWYFPGAETADGNWVDAGEEGEEIYAISVKPHMCWVYKAHSIWRIVGDLESGLLEQVTPAMGIVGPRAWASHGVVDYIRSNEGIYLMADKPYKVSQRVDPIFKGLSSGVVEPTSPADPSNQRAEVMAIVNDRLYHSYQEQ